MPLITKTLIAQTAPRAERYFVWDSKVPGFGLVVNPSGSMSFCFQYRTAQGRTRRMGLGSILKATPDEARERARRESAKVADGEDPLEIKRAKRDEPTLGEVCDEYLTSQAFLEKARSTRATDEGRIANHLRPLLGGRLAKSVTAEDVKRARRAIVAGKTAKNEKSGWRARSIVTGGEGAARQALRLLSAIYSWAIAEGAFGLTENPVANVKTGGDGERKIVMRNADDYRRLFATLEKMESEKRLRGDVADIVRLLALTGARRDEVAGLEWGEVDLDKGLIVIPPERHKTGRRTKSERIIGLPEAAREILRRQPRSSESPMVFPPRREDERGRAYPESKKGTPGRVNVTRPWRTIRREAGLPDGIGLHGLRHSLATHLAMQGAQAAEIMTALGHRRLATAQKYVHWAEDSRAALAERAATIVTNAMKRSEQ